MQRFLQNNQIVQNILFGKGFTRNDNKVWYPKEVWIYSCFKNETKKLQNTTKYKHQ
jgi:hypothetical protein